MISIAVLYLAMHAHNKNLCECNGHRNEAGFRDVMTICEFAHIWQCCTPCPKCRIPIKQFELENHNKCSLVDPKNSTPKPK